MAGISSILLAVGIGAGIVGTGISLYGQAQQTKAAKQAEAAREKQMNLEASRRRREIVRNRVLAQAQATSNAFNQGAGQGSGLQGGLAQASGEANSQTSAIDQNQSLGSDIFAANQAYYNASRFTDFGQGLSSLGNQVVSNLPTISRVATYGFGRATA